MAKSKDAWKALREDIISNLDIRREYENFGIKFTGKTTSKGWAEAHAYGRDDSTPSAGVNLETGVYKDFTGSTMNIFDFMVHAGKASDWQDAQQQLAKTAGLGARIPKKARAKRPDELLGFNKTFVVASVMGLCRKYGVKPDVLEKTGVRIARYPAKSPQPQIVLAFPIYSPISLLEQPPESYVVQASGENEMINVYQGPTAPPRPEKRIVLGTTGILNRFALENWQTAERIYKVEGLSDMLTLQNFIPEELRKKHIVITNACGADDGGPAWELAAHCSGKEFVIIHDADVPGQFGTSRDKTGGAQRWVSALKPVAKSVKNVQLPYEVQLKHGKDLRDWIGEPGRTYADLEELVRLTPPEEVQGSGSAAGASGDSEPTELSEFQKDLNRLGLTVLGRRTSGTKTIISVHSKGNRRTFEIPDIDRWTYLNALTELGGVAERELTDDAEKHPLRLTIQQVRKAIAYEASDRLIDSTSTLGLGAWEVNGELIMVGAGEWIRQVDGRIASSEEPRLEKYLLRLGQATDEWFRRDEIEKHQHSANDSTWRKGVFEELTEIFERWDNWGPTSNEKEVRAGLIASLALATLVQDIWVFRPWVSITGEANAGKSTLFEVLESFFGPLAFRAGGGTEAGFRQKLGLDSRALLIDEFEASHERNKILDWLRNAGGGASIVRGTPGHKHHESRVKALPWFGATESNMKRETERTRYIQFRMASRKGRPRFERPTKSQLTDLRHKALAILFAVWKRARELENHLITTQAIKEISHRYTETHAIPVAMWSAVLGESENECSQRFQMVMKFMLPEIQFSAESEYMTLLGVIASQVVPVGHGESRSIEELLSSTSYRLPSSESPSDVLGRIGIRKMSGDSFRSKEAVTVDPSKLYVFIVHSVFTKYLKGTDYEGKGIDQILIRAPGAFRTAQRVLTSTPRGVAIPLETMFPSTLPPDRAEVPDGFVPQEHRPRVPNSIADDLRDL